VLERAGSTDFAGPELPHELRAMPTATRESVFRRHRVTIATGANQRNTTTCFTSASVMPLTLSVHLWALPPWCRTAPPSRRTGHSPQKQADVSQADVSMGQTVGQWHGSSVADRFVFGVWSQYHCRLRPMKTGSLGKPAFAIHDRAGDVDHTSRITVARRPRSRTPRHQRVRCGV